VVGAETEGDDGLSSLRATERARSDATRRPRASAAACHAKSDNLSGRSLRAVISVPSAQSCVLAVSTKMLRAIYDTV
jgi:hypothetical protein